MKYYAVYEKTGEQFVIAIADGDYIWYHVRDNQPYNIISQEDFLRRLTGVLVGVTCHLEA